MQRHPVTQFHPKATIEIIAEEQNVSNELSENEKKSLIERYLDVSFFFVQIFFALIFLPKLLSLIHAFFAIN